MLTPHPVGLSWPIWLFSKNKKSKFVCFHKANKGETRCLDHFACHQHFSLVCQSRWEEMKTSNRQLNCSPSLVSAFCPYDATCHHLLVLLLLCFGISCRVRWEKTVTEFRELTCGNCPTVHEPEDGLLEVSDIARSGVSERSSLHWKTNDKTETQSDCTVSSASQKFGQNQTKIQQCTLSFNRCRL